MKAKVVFVIPNLDGGGAERTVLNICSRLDRARFNATLVLAEKRGRYLHLLPPDIPVIELGVAHVSRGIPQLAQVLRRLDAEIVFSTLTHMNVATVLAALVAKVRSKIVVREANVYSMAYAGSRGIKRMVLSCFIRYLYNSADKIVFLSRGVAEDFRKCFPSIDPTKYEVIYNPIAIDEICRLKQEPIDEPWWDDSAPKVIVVGRLTRQKGHKHLLDAFQIVLQSVKDARLMILGTGEQRDALERYATQVGVAPNVTFLGFKDNPYKYMARSDVFVLPSLWEGFGHVIVEAMACGVPVVASDCPSGPAEIITSGHDGMLVPVGDPQAIAHSIISVLKDPRLGDSLRQNGFRRAMDFEAKKIVTRYEHLFSSLLD